MPPPKLTYIVQRGSEFSAERKQPNVWTETFHAVWHSRTKLLQIFWHVGDTKIIVKLSGQSIVEL